MSRSGAGSATLRWILLGLLVAVAVVVSYIAIEASDLALGTVSSSVIAAVGSGCLVLVAALYVLSLRARSTEGIKLRLDRIAAPTTPPNSDDSQRESEPGGAEDEFEPTDEADIEEPAMATGKPRDPETSPPDPESTVDATAPGVQPIQSAPSRQVTANTSPSPPPGSSTPSRDEIDAGGFREDPGFDAMRLAAALNQYEQTGVPTDSPATSSATRSQRDERDLGERELWNDLVEAYGAESIDLSGIRAGRCRITLRSGNMVLYVPEYRQWVWLVFTRSDRTTPTVSDESPIDRGVNGSARDAEMNTMPPANPEPAGIGGGQETRSVAENGLMRLARSTLGRSNPNLQPGPTTIRVVGMTQVLSSQNTPAAYEEALFVTEGLLLGAAYGNRVVPYEELVWVVEAATGHLMQMQSMGRFLGDLVDRSYPRHMDVLSALAVPATSMSQPAVEGRDRTKLTAAQPAEEDGSAADGTVVDLTDTGIQSHHQDAVGQPS